MLGIVLSIIIAGRVNTEFLRILFYSEGVCGGEGGNKDMEGDSASSVMLFFFFLNQGVCRKNGTLHVVSVA